MALDLVVGSPPKIDKVATGFGFTEGPVFSRRGYLLFSDVSRESNPAMGGRKCQRPSGKTATALMDSHSIIKAGCSLVSKVVLLERKRMGASRFLHRRLKARRLNSPNDLVYAIDGSIYFSVIQPRGSAST